MSFFIFLKLLNFDQQYVPRGKTLVATAIKMETNPIRTAIRVCDGLIKQQVIKYNKS